MIRWKYIILSQDFVWPYALVLNIYHSPRYLSYSALIILSMIILRWWNNALVLRAGPNPINVFKSNEIFRTCPNLLMHIDVCKLVRLKIFKKTISVQKFIYSQIIWGSRPHIKIGDCIVLVEINKRYNWSNSGRTNQVMQSYILARKASHNTQY